MPEGPSRAPDKLRIFISFMSIFSLNPMFDQLLESSHRDKSNKWSNMGFSEEIMSIEVNFMHIIQGFKFMSICTTCNSHRGTFPSHSKSHFFHINIQIV